jgi:hypothetical protein
MLVFYSKKGQVTFLGYGTNWNTTGYMEFNIPVGKYR